MRAWIIAADLAFMTGSVGLFCGTLLHLYATIRGG
jgi:hypothetical protein